MGLSKIRGRGMNVANGFARPPGLGQPMKHMQQMGPHGMRPRFPLPPPGMPVRMSYPPPAMRPPAMRPPAMRPPAMRPPGMMPPGYLHHLPPPNFGVPPQRPHFLPHLPPPTYLPPVPPVTALRGSHVQEGFGPPPSFRGKRGAASYRGGKGRMRGKKITNVGKDLDPELDKPWISESIKKEILKKQELLQKAQKSNSECDWKEYKSHKEKVAIIVQEAKLEFIGSHPEEAAAYYCETCDRDLKDPQKFAEHMAEHTVCGQDGCTFQAHPKVVEKHIRMQHWTGLYKKICTADNPEDVAKWIEERKKQYPTKANKERREAEKRERMDRGERLGQEPQRFNSFARGRLGRGAGRGMQGRMRGHRRRHARRPGAGHNSSEMEGWNAQVVEEEKMTRRGSLVCFPGTGAFLEDCEDINTDVNDGGFSDGEWEGSSSVSRGPKPLVASKALMMLMGTYASDVSDNEGNGESAVVETPPVVPPIAEISPSNTVTEGQLPDGACVQNDSDDAPQEAPIVFSKQAVELPASPPAADRSAETPHHHNRRHNRHGKTVPQLKTQQGAGETVSNESPQQPVVMTPRHHRLCRPTLLDKLLKDEIRHERNVILQCVNHVVKCNFFDVRSFSKAANSVTQSSFDNPLEIST